MKKITLLFFAMFTFSLGFSQADCATALALTPGISQAGDTTGQAGSFSDSNTAPEVNPCSTSYNDLEYWFKYTAVETGETLNLTVTNLTSNWYGIFIIDNCPDSAPACVAQDTNGSNMDDLSVITPSLTAGTTYYIVLSDFIEGPTTFTLSSTLTAAPTCLAPTGVMATPISTTETDFTWTAGDAETGWTYEYGTTGFVEGNGTSGTTTVESLSLLSLTPGETYDIYVRANCGGTDGDSAWTTVVSWRQPNIGDSCATPISATVEVDCSTATPYTIDYATAGDLGITDLSCDTFGINTGAWFEFTAPASGGVKVTFTDTNEYALFSACSTQVSCVNTATNEGLLTSLTVGATYKLAVWKDSATTGTTDVCFEDYTPPVAPECATTPSPADGSTDIPVGNATLTWVAGTTGTTPTSYDLYSGIESDGSDLALVGNYTTATADVTLTGYSTTIYWQIRPKNGPSEASGCPLWSLTTEAAPPPPPNDDCSTATLVDGALPFNNTGDATSATNNDGFIIVTDCAIGMNDGVWYTFTPITGGTIDIAITGVTGWDPEVAIYSGSCGTFTCVDSVDNFGAGGSETLTGVAVVAGTQYWINLGHFDSSADNPEGPYSIEISTADTVGLSVEDNKIEGFSLYPNPVNDRLHFNALDTIDELSIYNLLGQEILRTQPNALTTEIDVTNLPTGMYVVKVKVGDQLGSYKIIKE